MTVCKGFLISQRVSQYPMGFSLAEGKNVEVLNALTNLRNYQSLSNEKFNMFYINRKYFNSFNSKGIKSFPQT